MIGVLHTTESDQGSGPTIDGLFQTTLSGDRPHVLVDPANGGIWYYFKPDTNSLALLNAAGGVETNRRTGGVYQVEIVGRAADVGGYSDQWYGTLQHMLAQLSTLSGVPYIFHTNAARLAPEVWASPNLPAAWYRHSNVPENDHWDPGTLDYSRLALAPTQGPGPDMDITTTYTDKTTVNDRALWTGDAVKRIEETDIPAIQADLAAVKNTLQALLTVANATSQAPKVSVAIDYILLANTVADVLAQRMAK